MTCRVCSAGCRFDRPGICRECAEAEHAEREADARRRNDRAELLRPLSEAAMITPSIEASDALDALVDALLELGIISPLPIPIDYMTRAMFGLFASWPHTRQEQQGGFSHVRGGFYETTDDAYINVDASASERYRMRLGAWRWATKNPRWRWEELPKAIDDKTRLRLHYEVERIRAEREGRG